jgi:DNA polymerase III epsilon subunit-like protein
MQKTVFLGSTSTDLTDVRAELRQVIPSLGFALICFEDSKFKKEPGKHAHDICLDNVRCCDIYVLIIDERYGEEYQGSKTALRGKSVTWAEVEVALEEGKVICAFVRRQVWLEKATWAYNRDMGIKVEPFYAKDARVFEFIEFIASRPKDNWFDQFDDSLELKTQMKDRLSPMAASG